MIWLSFFSLGIGLRYLLAELIEGSPIYTVQAEGDGFTFLAAENRLAEFSEIVRRASEKAGNEYLVFPTPAGSGLYQAMYILPIPDEAQPTSSSE